MHDILGLLVTLMFVGYAALEIGRFRRARDLGREPVWYSWTRVVVRLSMGSIVVCMAWMWAAWDEISRRFNEAPIVVFSGLGALMALLVLDLVGLLVQFALEKERREQEFLSDVERMVENRAKRDSSSGNEKTGAS